MKIFARVLSPGGIIVFTTAGEYVAERLTLGEISGLDVEGANNLLAQFHERGYGYTVYPRAPEVPWGRTLFSRTGLENLYAQLADDYQLLASMPRAMIGRQDVSIVQRRH